MPSYFFHLKLELYPALATTDNRLSTKHATQVFVPALDSNIFTTPLPSHKTSRWASYHFPKRPATGDTTSPSESEPSQSPRRLPSSQPNEPHGDALLLPERSLNHKDHVSPSPALTPAKLSNQVSAKDWRYGEVSIESIDMEISSKTAVAGSKAGVRSAASGLHTKALYVPSDPKTTDVGWGIVHLYRDTEESHFIDGEEFQHKSLDKHIVPDQSFSAEDCTTLCILAVPSWMMPSDLLGFVGDQAREDVSHFRLIRTGRANKYMVLLKFRSPKKAKEFQKTYNGRLFSSAEPENCHVVFIKSVEFLTPEDSDLEDNSSFPHNTNDPFTPAKGKANGTVKSLSSKPLAPPPPNLLELPTCPVCLERMDETTGLLTILCQHVFHCACLEKWRGSGCPVCRYTHSPSYTFPYPRNNGISTTAGEEEDQEPMCSVCASLGSVWVCLICGNLGCGRYDSAHAYAHYESTSHCYAMDISTQHVWDYAGDGYVHRLIQSKPDGKAMDLPSARTRHENEAFRVEGSDSVPREKMDTMATEYTCLLTSQLEGQRRYFEEQVERAVDKACQASARAEDAAARVGQALKQLETAQSERETCSSALGRLEKAFERSEKARVKFEQLSRDLSSSLREEKIMNEGLLKRIRAADEKAELAKLEAERAVEGKRELEESNRDLTMFISGQEKLRELQAQGEDVVEGSVSLPPEKRGNGKGKKKR